MSLFQADLTRTGNEFKRVGATTEKAQVPVFVTVFECASVMKFIKKINQKRYLTRSKMASTG